MLILIDIAVKLGDFKSLASTIPPRPHAPFPMGWMRKRKRFLVCYVCGGDVGFADGVELGPRCKGTPVPPRRLRWHWRSGVIFDSTLGEVSVRAELKPAQPEHPPLLRPCARSACQQDRRHRHHRHLIRAPVAAPQFKGFHRRIIRGVAKDDHLADLAGLKHGAV